VVQYKGRPEDRECHSYASPELLVLETLYHISRTYKEVYTFCSLIFTPNFPLQLVLGCPVPFGFNANDILFYLIIKPTQNLAGNFRRVLVSTSFILYPFASLMWNSPSDCLNSGSSSLSQEYDEVVHDKAEDTHLGS
jgi:hypothetical protein